MEKVDTETHDFMSVESFSQLPFIHRPAPPVREKPGIRLFGIELGGINASATEESFSGETTTAACEERKEFDNGGDNGRKFECHYCCRNFPTSQALGGHQNAHKRERQHAKRAHIHSSTGASMFHGGYRLSSAPPTPPIPSYHRHSWNVCTTNNSSGIYDSTAGFYGSSYGSSSSYSHHHQAINGNPMESLLGGNPVVQSSGYFNRDRSFMHRPLLLFSNDEMKPSPLIGSSSSQTVEDHVSLDLHL